MSGCKSPRDQRVARHVSCLPKSGIRDFFELVLGMDDVISLGVGEPDYVTPWHIREHTVYCLEKGHTSYTSNLGLMSLRKAVCAHIEKTRGVRYDPATECIITVGVSEALDLAVRALADPGDEFIYHEPCYVSYAPEIAMAHGVPVPVETTAADGFALDPERVASKVTARSKALILNFPCNPTGAVLDAPRMEALAGLAIARDLVVVTDEIYSELTYDGSHRSIASLPGMRERTLLLHGFSKAYAMTGFRVGYACGPRDIIDAMMKIHQYSMLCASIVAQRAAEEALARGEREMLAMRDSYRERRDLIVAGLRRAGLSCHTPGGAFYAFPSVASTGMDAKSFALRLLREKKVAVVPGTAFGPSGEGHVRCAYAAAREDIVEALDRIASMLGGG